MPPPCLLIIFEMFLTPDWSPSEINSNYWIGFGKAYVCRYNIYHIYHSRNQATVSNCRVARWKPLMWKSLRVWKKAPKGLLDCEKQDFRIWWNQYWRENPQIEVCKDCYVIPKKARGCNHCQSSECWVKGLNTYVNVLFQFCLSDKLAEISKVWFSAHLYGVLCVDWWEIDVKKCEGLNPHWMYSMWMTLADGM